MIRKRWNEIKISKIASNINNRHPYLTMFFAVGGLLLNIHNVINYTQEYHSESSTFEALLGSSYTPDGGVCSNQDLIPYIIETGSGTEYHGIAREIDSPTDFDYERVPGGLEKIVAPTENGDKTTFERDIECSIFGIKHNYKDVPEHLQGVYKEAFERGSQRVGEIFEEFSQDALSKYEQNLQQKQEKYRGALDNL